MSGYYYKFENFISSGKNFYAMFFFLAAFLFVTKLPSILSTDVQPWDEGMYAVRVLSINSNGDFLDQSEHSVGKFYSGSHPPLLIWIGYFVTLIFGFDSAVFKIISYIFSMLCLLVVFLIGKNSFSQKTGFYAALIFSSNIIFNIFSKRFQFDFPYTFFILLSFYSLFLFNDNGKLRYLVISGISFGCCLMVKILVGLFIPSVILTSYFFIRKKINIKFKDIILLSAIGVAIALPWHIFMIIKHGSEFTDFFFGFHLFERAFEGVEMNEKSSGMFFYLKFLLTIIPFSIILMFAFFNDLINFKNLSWKKIFLWVWFLIGFFVITFFKTKLEVYALLVLPPLSLLIPSYIEKFNGEKRKLKILLLLAVSAEVCWSVMNFLKLYTPYHGFETGIYLAIITTALFIISIFAANKIELKKSFYIFILIYFFLFNIFFAFRINAGESDFKISPLVEHIKKEKKAKIVYVGSGYRYNPQFSFYFNGMNLNWEHPDYEFELIDTKDDVEKTKKLLGELKKNDCFIIVEKDNINRGNYINSRLFVPDDFKLVMKQEGYELYEN